MATNDISIKRLNDTRFYSLRVSFSMYPIRGTYTKLQDPPQMKELIKNENRLRNGAQYFITQSAFLCKERNIELPFLMLTATSDILQSHLKGIQTYLSKELIYFRVPRLNTVYKLVYTGMTDLKKYLHNSATFTLRFLEPDPTDRLTIDEMDELLARITNTDTSNEVNSEEF